jgi:hypothetical protein
VRRHQIARASPVINVLEKSRAHVGTAACEAGFVSREPTTRNSREKT